MGSRACCREEGKLNLSMVGVSHGQGKELQFKLGDSTEMWNGTWALEWSHPEYRRMSNGK